MPPKKVAKSAMKKAKAKAMKKTKPMKVKDAKKKPAASSVPHTQGRWEFNSAACRGAQTHPLGGLGGEFAHAGVPAAPGLIEIWSAALQRAYSNVAVSAWAEDNCVKGEASCWQLFHHIHKEYDYNNQPKDADTHMVAFLPVEKKFPDDFPKPVANEEPYDAHILCRGDAAREAVQAFIGAAGLKHGLKVEGSKCYIGDFITICKQEYPDELKKAAEDLKQVEFNYEEAKKLQLIGRNGKDIRKADYNCITKNDVMEEVKKLADMATVRVGLRGGCPDWCIDGTSKYMKVNVMGVVHWFSLRMRACRILRHRHLGGLPNGGEECESESQDLSESEVEILRQAPLAWNPSSICLKEGA